MIDLFYAYLAGVLTLINPCILPLLPVVLAASVQKHWAGPLALATGLGLSFAVLGFLITVFARSIGLDSEGVSRAAAALMIVFGLVLLVPKAGEVFAKLTGGIANKSNVAIDAHGVVDGEASGAMQLRGQFLTGVLLGVVWVPCIGPTLGGAIGFAAQGEKLGQAFAIMVFFALGTMTIILALAYGSRELILRRRNALMGMMVYARPIMGVSLVLVGLAIWFHFERIVEGFVLSIMPVWLADLSVYF